MSKPDYSAVDAAILTAIRAHRSPIYDPDANSAARIAAPDRDDYRVIDGRLQKLRRNGVIRANRKARAGWELADG